ncbi:MAG: MFS transporter [Candidatus Eremiobacteraeota bacterium]|nr:MFS transporter [Candidatus Eremiobacteraeota bacterium]MBV9700372.1 MFS transporter [Candidatus Eremiobacteraeota bacterium]
MLVRLPCDDKPVHRARPARVGISQGVWVLAAAILGSAMSGIDGTAVNVALPVLQRDLHASGAATQWVVEGYSLFLSALILVGGSLGDHLGRRRMFLVGVCIFAAASLGCGVAQTSAQLIAVRCIQGIGGALLVPESLALITAFFDEKQRGAAIGTWSGFLAATMAIGPLLGGWFVQALSWRLIFFINIPIALAIVLIALRYVPESRDKDVTPRLDWTGAILATAALGALTYALISLQPPATAAAYPILAAGVALSILFVLLERRSRNPMVPLEIFKSSDFTIANVYTLLLYAALGGAFFFVPFNLINVQHYTPFAAGAALLPMIVLMFASSRWSGGLVTRLGARIPLTVGAFIAGCGFIAFGFTGVGHSYWTSFFPAIVLLGIGTSTFVAPLTTTVMNSAPSEHAGSASGVNNAISRVAGVLAIAILGIVIVASAHRAVQHDDRALPVAVQRTLESQSLLSGRVPDRAIPQDLRPAVQRTVTSAFLAGFRNAMLLSAALAWISALLALIALRPKQKLSAVSKKAPP